MASRSTLSRTRGGPGAGTAGNGPAITPRAVRTPAMSTPPAAAASTTASAVSRPPPQQPTAPAGRARTNEPHRPSQLQPSSSDSSSDSGSDSERRDDADAKKLETAAQDDYQHMFAMSRFQIAKLKRQLAAASAAAAAGKAPTTAQTAQLEAHCQKLQTQVAALQAQLAAQPSPQDDAAVAAAVLQHQAQLEAMIAERKQLLVQLLKLSKKSDASTQCDDLMPLNAAPPEPASKGDTKDADTQTDAQPETPTVKASVDQTADIDQLTRAVQVYKKSSAMHQRLADDLSVEVQELRKQLQARMAAPLPSPSLRAMDAAHSQLEAQLQELHSTVLSKDAEIADLKSQLTAANKERQSLNRQVTLKTSKLNRLSEALDKAQADVRAANLRLEKEQASVARLRQQLASAPSPRIRPAASSARVLLPEDASPRSELGRARQFPSGLRALASMPSLPIGMSSSSPESAVATSTSFTTVDDDMFSPVHAVPSTPTLQTVQESVTFLEVEPQSQATPVLSVVPPPSTTLVFDEPQATADVPVEQAAPDKPVVDVTTPSDSVELHARRPPLPPPPLPPPSQSGVMASPVLAPARDDSSSDAPFLMPRRLSTSSAAPMSSNASVVSGVGTRVRAPITSASDQPTPHVSPWPTVRLQPLTAHRDTSVGDIV